MLGAKSERTLRAQGFGAAYHRSNFVHKIGGFHGQKWVLSGFVHKIGPFHGQNESTGVSDIVPQ